MQRLNDNANDAFAPFLLHPKKTVSCVQLRYTCAFYDCREQPIIMNTSLKSLLLKPVAQIKLIVAVKCHLTVCKPKECRNKHIKRQDHTYILRLLTHKRCK